MAARISALVALGKNRVIGKGNELLWHIPDDLKRFKALTLGRPVIMGRKTFESIVAAIGKPLPGRTNIVVTRDPSFVSRLNLDMSDVLVVSSLKEALEKASTMDQEEIFIGGGAQIYEQVLPKVDRLYLTLIDGEQEGDTFFPPYEHLFTKKVFEEEHEWQGLKYTWVDLEKE
ncbi:MAG: dihydrofolate reductase [bacterium]